MDKLVPLPKLLVLRPPAPGETPRQEVAGQRLLQLGVRVVEYPVTQTVQRTRKHLPIERDTGAVLHQVDYMPDFSESPIPRSSTHAKKRQFTSVRDLTEADYRSPAPLSTIHEASETQEDLQGPPLTLEELTTSLPASTSIELRELQRFRMEVTQSVPDLIAWEQKYKHESDLVKSYTQEISGLKSELKVKSEELEKFKAKLAAEVRDKETIATLQKVMHLDRVMKEFHPPDRQNQYRGKVGRRQVGLRFKLPDKD